MSESFRPFESASIDEGLRIRLEGSIELLEDALPLLDSLMDLLARAEAELDDLATLQECVLQLPRIDEAIDKASRHEAAGSLTQAVGQRKKAALLAANARLETLGHAEVPSLRGAVSAVLDLVKRQGTAPRPGERPWAIAKGAPALLSLVLGIFVSWAGYALFDSAWAVILGVLAFGAALYTLTPSPWVLLADRLYFPAQPPKLPREVSTQSIQGVTVDGDKVVLLLPGPETLELHSSAPGPLASLLLLMKGPWLSGLQSPANWSTTLDAVGENGESGRALLSSEGVLFVPKSGEALVLAALTPEKLAAPPSLEDVLQLIAHLPMGRWEALGDHLMKSTDAIWLPLRELKVEDGGGAHLGARVRAGERSVRLMFSLKTGEDSQAQAEALLARLRR